MASKMCNVVSSFQIIRLQRLMTRLRFVLNTLNAKMVLKISIN